MAEPIEILFGSRTCMSPRNHELNSVEIPQCNGAILMEKGASCCKVYGHSAVICAKTAELIEMPFGL